MAEQSPDPWRILWRVVSSSELLIAVLLLIAFGVTLTAWIPQQPSSDVDYARWLSEMQARFGEATPAMRALGLFSITSSLGFRLLLALLAGCLIIRLVEGIDRLRRSRVVREPDEEWRRITGRQLSQLLEHLRHRGYRVVNSSPLFQVDRWPWSSVLPLTVHLGLLFLLISLLLSHLFGWQAQGLVLQSGERRSLPWRNGWVTLVENGDATRHSHGVVPYVEESGPGVQVSAVNGEGERLQLLLTSDAEPATELKLALTDDTYFAIPEAELIVRLTPRSQEPYSRADVQIYSSPAGRRISEQVTDKGGQATLNVGDVILTSVPAPYARVTATYNPGRLPGGLGIVMLVIGLIGSLTWPERRFWLRETETSIGAAGSFPSWLQVEEESQ